MEALAKGDATDAHLSPQDEAMLRYALKLTHLPHSIAASDIEELRSHGFSDTAVHDMAHVASYYNYVNRMAEGLGVELEASWDDDALVLTREEFEGRA